MINVINNFRKKFQHGHNFELFLLNLEYLSHFKINRNGNLKMDIKKFTDLFQCILVSSLYIFLESIKLMNYEIHFIYQKLKPEWNCKNISSSITKYFLDFVCIVLINLEFTQSKKIFKNAYLLLLLSRESRCTSR